MNLTKPLSNYFRVLPCYYPNFDFGAVGEKITITGGVTIAFDINWSFEAPQLYWILFFFLEQSLLEIHFESIRMNEPGATFPLAHGILAGEV